MADFDLGGLLFGNAPSSGLEGYLDPEQLRRMQQQGVMQAAMALLKASGPSTQRVGLGQALGGAYEAGQAGYQQAQQQGIAGLLTKQKLEEAERARKMQENYAKMVAGLTGGQAPEMGAMTSESALAAPVTPQLPAGPTVARAEMIGQPRSLGSPAVGGAMPRGTLTPQMATLLSQMTPKEGIQKLYELSQPPKTQGQAFKAADGNYYIQTENGGVIPAPIAPADLGAEEYGAPVAQVVNGQIQMVQYNKKGEPRIAQGTMPYEPQSPDIRSVEYLLGKNLGGTGAAGMGQVGEYRRTLAPITKVNVPVDMTGGQKGFENEMSLGKAFKAEPIYKDYSDMQSAYGQVVSSLKQGTPIGDVAGATKVMKLLDPGSVVRESELGIAMAAAGRMDRLQNYFSNMMSGQKLTPTQRDDFQSLSNELFAAASQAYNNKRREYEEFGTSYGFKNLGTALGAPATIPSLMRGGPGGAERKPLGSIFQPRN
jgi:hypothetical protein